MDRYLTIGITLLLITTLTFNECKKLEKCSFLKTLANDYHLEPKLAQAWTCLGDAISGLDSALKVSGTSNISYNGIFQISSEYWCESTTNKTGKGCNINCQNLLDENLLDDIKCVEIIYKQHSGFSAWPVYEKNCKDIDYREYFKDCADVVVVPNDEKSGKIYEKCELVRELHEQHGVPMDMLGTITCIAKEESQFNTAAIGRMNNDLSLDHGIFQISDKFWCLNDEKDEVKAGKNCDIPCSSLRDGDITDDVRCMKQIYEKTSQFSESGYDAWLVYTRNDSICKNPNTTLAMIDDCLTENLEIKQAKKSFQRCELARELKNLNVPLNDIPTFVCLAYHESKLTTSKVSKKGEHGLFQILEGKWCSSNDVSAVGCEVSCEAMHDQNITDDIVCAKKIRALLGFTAWKSYKGNCDGEKAKKFTENCGIDKKTEEVGLETRQTSVTKVAPFYLLHFSDPENSIRATLEIGKQNLKEGAVIKVMPILSTKSPNKMNGVSVVIEDGSK